MKRIKKILLTLCLLFAITMGGVNTISVSNALASEKYPYQTSTNFVLRSKFYTSYPSSTEERKENIKLAVKSLDKVFLEVNEEFSFNDVVGVRSEERGYKTAKIIVNGRFVDGVGGGVCQVSTTLYNAVLLAGLKITEYHPHTLPVSYIAPSFDAMVNSGGADLKFVNDTRAPLYMRAYADNSQIKIEVYGEQMQEKLVRQSVVTKTLEMPAPEIIKGSILEYPDMQIGDVKVLNYGKEGLVSEGFLISTINGVATRVRKIRTDTYKAMRSVIVEIEE